VQCADFDLRLCLFFLGADKPCSARPLSLSLFGHLVFLFSLPIGRRFQNTGACASVISRVGTLASRCAFTIRFRNSAFYKAASRLPSLSFGFGPRWVKIYTEPCLLAATNPVAPLACFRNKKENGATANSHFSAHDIKTTSQRRIYSNWRTNKAATLNIVSIFSQSLPFCHCGTLSPFHLVMSSETVALRKTRRKTLSLQLFSHFPWSNYRVFVRFDPATPTDPIRIQCL